MSIVKEKRTIVQVQTTLFKKIEPKYQCFLNSTNISKAPDSVVILAFKKEKILEMWFSDSENYVKVATYPILGASGVLGPKLKEGDNKYLKVFTLLKALILIVCFIDP